MTGKILEITHNKTKQGTTLYRLFVQVNELYGYVWTAKEGFNVGDLVDLGLKTDFKTRQFKVCVL